MRGGPWRDVGWAFSGPLWLFVWGSVTVSAPLTLLLPLGLINAEQFYSGPLPVLWWSVAAAPVLAAAGAARYTIGAGRRRGWVSFLRSTAVGTIVAVVGLLLSFAVYRWGIPLRNPRGGELLFGVPFAVAGAAFGHLVGLHVTYGHTRRGRVAAGTVIAVLGALIAPTTVERGADFGLDLDHRFPAFLKTSDAGSQNYVVPEAGRYGIYAVGSAATDSGCRLTGPDGRRQSAHALAVHPGTPGVDARPEYRWIAQFDAPAPGTYSLMCRTDTRHPHYSLGTIPKIRGVVGPLARWPLPAIWLIGALPGLLLIADAALRRNRSAPDTSMTQRRGDR